MDSFLNNLIPSASQHSVGWEDAPFLARLTGVYTPTTGTQTGINLYSFIEQSFDPTTGIPFDLPAGRQTYPPPPYNPALDYVPTSAYAIEVNDALITVPSSSPAGYPAGPFVEMRLKGVVEGVPVYEFSYSAASPEVITLACITSTDSQTVVANGAKGWPCVTLPLTQASGFIISPGSGLVGWSTGGLQQNGWIVTSPQNYTPIWNAVYRVVPLEGASGTQINSDIDGKPLWFLEYQVPYAETETAATFLDHPSETVGVFAPIHEPSGNNFVADTGITMGTDWIALGLGPTGVGTGGLPVQAIDLYIASNYPSVVPGTVYKGATGTDGIGNIFASGLCVTVGGQGGGGTSGTGTGGIKSLDMGSDW